MTARRFREAVVAAWAALMAALAAGQPAAAPPYNPTKAARYAPAVWLAQEEPFYPMLPHAFAFDGIDNDRDGCFDLQDPDEIKALANARVYRGEGRKAHLSALRKVFGTLLDVRHCVERGVDVKRCAAQFRQAEEWPVPACTDKEHTLADFSVCGHFFGREGEFRCGPDAVVIHGDAVEPIEPAKTGARNADTSRTFGGIQYWMYYPWDAEHVDDGEHVSVFYDLTEEAMRPDNVKVVVGAGHLPNTANNLLYASIDPHTETVGPRALPPHLPFLVELGKHASAPDFNCNGEFDIGVDANEGPQGVWGSRDVAVQINKKGINQFDPWMSVPRDGTGFLVERSFFDAAAARDAWKESCPEFTRGRYIMEQIAQVVARDKEQARYGPEGIGRTAVATHAYRLLSASLLKDLSEVGSDATLLKTFLEAAGRRTALWGKDVPETVASVASCQGKPCTAEWGTPTQAPHIPRKLRGRRDVWTHGDYWKAGSGEYDNDFKRNLFKQYGFGLAYQVWGGNGMPGVIARASGNAFGFIPESSLDLGVWFDSLNDGVLKAHGLKTSRPSGVSLTYNAFRTAYRGIYVGGAWTARDYEITRARVVADGQPVEADVIQTYRGNLTLYGGYTVGIAGRAARFGVRAGGHASLIRGRNETAHQTTRPAGIHISVEAVFGFRNDPHPLTR